MSGHSSAKSSPLPTYFAVFFALLVGTGLTVYELTLSPPDKISGSVMLK